MHMGKQACYHTLREVRMQLAGVASHLFVFCWAGNSRLAGLGELTQFSCLCLPSCSRSAGITHVYIRFFVWIL